MMDLSIKHEHRATWKNLDGGSLSGWNVVKVFRRAPGFGFGELLYLGFDCTKPAERQFETEMRIAERFEVKDLIDLVLEIQ